MNRTGIEWTDWSCNPLKLQMPDGALVNACQKISPGCGSCYAESYVRRFWRKAWGEFPGYSKSLLRIGKPFLVEDELQAVLRLDARIEAGKADPNENKIFWNDVTDECLEFWPDAMRDKIWAVRALTPRLIHQVLTKRAERMRDYLCKPVEVFYQDGTVTADRSRSVGRVIRVEMKRYNPGSDIEHLARGWPLSNAWLGVSVEDQQRKDRIGLLLQTPAAVRFVSNEPYLEYVDPVPGIDQWITGVESNGKRIGRLGRFYDEHHMTEAMRMTVSQCRLHGIAPFVKQIPINGRVSHDPAEWPADLRVREYPEAGKVTS